MNVIKEGQSVDLKATASLEYVDLGENLAVFRLIKEVTPEAPLPGLLGDTGSKTVTEGFVGTRELQMHVAGEAPFPQQTEGVCLAPKNLRKLAARYGFCGGMKKAAEEEKGYNRWRPFTALVDGHASPDQLLVIDSSSEMLFDRRGNVLPTAIAFEYIMAGMHNARYDLTRALEILKQNDRIHFLDHHGYPADTPKILSIPSYNATEFQTRYLNFVFEPTEEEMQRMWERQLSYDDRHPSTELYRAEFELDILGLRAGGAALFEYPEQALDINRR